MPRFRPLTVVATVLAALAGCSSSTTNSGSAPASTTAGTTAAGPAAPSGPITVFAAASLTESFTQLGKRFEAAHPGTTVRFAFGASSTLARQITNGAPADVFASASPTIMDQVVSAGDAAHPTTFARNVLEIAVPPDNPARISALADLARPGVKVAECAPQVPCGKLAAKVLAAARVTVKPVTEGIDVKAVLTLVKIGEVDAGLVYVTDVRSAGRKVVGVPIPASVNSATSYPIAVVTRSANAGTAQAFVDFVLSPAGRQALAAAGFTGP